MKKTIPLTTLKDTKKLAATLARASAGGMILALTGPIGAGKTTFVKYLAAAFGITKTVVSPTFTLIQPYQLKRARHGVRTLVHIDCYRIDDPRELIGAGIKDFLTDPGALVVIEWAEKLSLFLKTRAHARHTPVVWLDFSLSPNGERVCVLRHSKALSGFGRRRA